MKIIVVNLERSRDRRQRITTSLESLGLDYQLHTAVDGKNLPEEYDHLIDRKGSHRDGMPIRMGSIANWISQRQVFQDLVDNGPDVITVLEDDAVLTPELPSVLHSLESRSSAFEIVFLHFGPDRPFMPFHNLPSGHRLGCVRWSHFGTQGYTITRKAASVFLQRYLLVRTGIDRALAAYWRHGLRTYCVRPPVVSHHAYADGNRSQIWSAPIIKPSDPFWRLRRGWFYGREGFLKRAALSRIVLKTHGLADGLAYLMKPHRSV